MQTETTTTQTTTKTETPKKEARREREKLHLTPPLDVYESATGALAIVDLPGVAKENLELTVEKDRVTVIAKRTTTRYEITLSRAFLIPRDIDAENIEAKLERGVLTLTLPRLASARPRQIPVSGA
ncbi:MAG TPA: Hsp20/alpha crystallin family protein [Polyangiaceae bacterium]|jgi:HSP20 family molecular chaperone IbpA|nr:Hsp20/alpha crystallin family protein [Polyangiaceae bacterium]